MEHEQKKDVAAVLEEKLDDVSSILDEIREAIVNLTQTIASKQ